MGYTCTQNNLIELFYHIQNICFLTVHSSLTHLGQKKAKINFSLKTTPTDDTIIKMAADTSITFGMMCYLVVCPLFHSSIFSLLIYFYVTDVFYTFTALFRVILLSMSVIFADQVGQIIVFLNLSSLFATAIAFICYQQSNMNALLLYLHVAQLVASLLLGTCFGNYPLPETLSQTQTTESNTSCLRIFVRQPLDKIKLDVQDITEDVCGQCSICLFDLVYPPNQVAKTKCQHLFHTSCLEKWCFKRYRQNEQVCCPLCRSCIRLKLYA